MPARFSWAIIVWRVTISLTVASAILGFISIVVIALGAAKLFKDVWNVRRIAAASVAMASISIMVNARNVLIFKDA